MEIDDYYKAETLIHDRACYSDLKAELETVLIGNCEMVIKWQFPGTSLSTCLIDTSLKDNVIEFGIEKMIDFLDARIEEINDRIKKL